MIINTFHGPASAELGFAQGTDFNCNASICYGIGAERHAQFQLLQQLLNSFTKPALLVDGFLGASTVEAATRVARGIAAIGSPFTSVAKLAAGNVTKAQLATLADDFILALNLFLTTQQVAWSTEPQTAPPSTPTTPPSTPSRVPVAPASTSALPTASGWAPSPSARPPAQLPTGPTPTAPATSWQPAPPAKRSKTPYLIAGGIVALLLVGGTGYVVARHRKDA